MAVDRARLGRRLALNALFSTLDGEALAELAGAARLRTLRRGDVLWRRGERTDALAVVLSGRLDVSRTTEDGARMLLRVLQAGDAVGLSTVAGEAHSADLTAGDDVELAVLPGRTLRGLFARRPALALGAIARLGELLRRLTDEVEELRFQDLDERVLRCIARHAGGRREIRFTHEELAEQVGATRANVSRALKRLERRGAIRCGRRRIEILELRAARRAT